MDRPVRAAMAETPTEWRQAGRVLEQIEIGPPDHETAQMAVAESRDLYLRVTERAGLEPTTDVRSDDPAGSSAKPRRMPRICCYRSRRLPESPIRPRC